MNKFHKKPVGIEALPFSPYLVFEWVSPTERTSWTAYTADQMRDYALRAQVAEVAQPSADAMVDAEALAVRFHEAYERLAPSFGYETRTETRAFDPTTPNGRLMIAVCGELLPTAAPQPDARDVAANIDAMVNKFLAWRLPDDFYPDAGISFTPVTNPQWTHDSWPVGTNLLTAEQARAMFKHVCMKLP